MKITDLTVLLKYESLFHVYYFVTKTCNRKYLQFIFYCFLKELSLFDYSVDRYKKI